MPQPEKVATPCETVTVSVFVASNVPVSQLKVPLPGFVLRPKVTVVELSPVSTLPPASSTDTTGSGDRPPEPESLPGCVVKTNWVAVPMLTVTEELVTVTALLTVSVAVKVWLPAVSNVTPFVNV